MAGILTAVFHIKSIHDAQEAEWQHHINHCSTSEENKEEKINDLQSLKQYIPPVHHNFYDNPEVDDESRNVNAEDAGEPLSGKEFDFSKSEED